MKEVRFQLFRVIFMPYLQNKQAMKITRNNSCFPRRLKQIFNVIDSEPKVTLGYQAVMMSSNCLDLDYFELVSCILFRSKYYSKRLENIFEEFDSEPIVTLGYKIIMTSAKCLDFNYFVLYSDTLFKTNNFPKRLRQIFDVIHSEPIVILGYKAMVTSPNQQILIISSHFHALF